MHLSIGAVENCKNPESYGTICVRCNLCGRFASDNGCKDEKQAETVAGDNPELKEVGE